MHHRYVIPALLLAAAAIIASSPLYGQDWVRIVNVRSIHDLAKVHVTGPSGFDELIESPAASFPVAISAGQYQISVWAPSVTSVGTIGSVMIDARGDSTMYTIVISGGSFTRYSVIAHRMRVDVPPDSVYVRVVNALSGTPSFVYDVVTFADEGSFVRGSVTVADVASEHHGMKAGDLKFTCSPAGGRRVVRVSSRLIGAASWSLVVVGSYDSTNLSSIEVYGLDDSYVGHPQILSAYPFEMAGRGMVRFANTQPTEVGFSTVTTPELPGTTVRVASGTQTAMRTDIGGPAQFNLLDANENPLLAITAPLAAGLVHTVVLHDDSTASGPALTVLSSDVYNHPWTFGRTTVRIFPATGALHGCSMVLRDRETSETSTYSDISYAVPTSYRFAAAGRSVLTITSIRGNDTARRSFTGMLPHQGLVTLLVSGDPFVRGSMVVFAYDERNLQDSGAIPRLERTSAVEAPQEVVSTLSAFPNPTAGITRLQFNATHAGRVFVAVLDNAGREVLRRSYDCSTPGRQSIALETSSLPAGGYTAVVHADRNAVIGAARIVVQR